MFGVLHLLIQVLGLLAFAMLVPAAIAVVGGDADNAENFLLVAGLTGFITGAVFFALRGRPWRLGRFAAFMLVLSVWVVPPLIAAVPIMDGIGINYLSAVFEAVSAYTTTGATTLSSLDTVEPGLGRLWESLKQAVRGVVRIERRDSPLRASISAVRNSFVR